MKPSNNNTLSRRWKPGHKYFLFEVCELVFVTLLGTFLIGAHTNLPLLLKIPCLILIILYVINELKRLLPHIRLSFFEVRPNTKLISTKTLSNDYKKVRNKQDFIQATQILNTIFKVKRLLPYYRTKNKTDIIHHNQNVTLLSYLYLVRFGAGWSLKKVRSAGKLTLQNNKLLLCLSLDRKHSFCTALFIDSIKKIYIKRLIYE